MNKKLVVLSTVLLCANGACNQVDDPVESVKEGDEFRHAEVTRCGQKTIVQGDGTSYVLDEKYYFENMNRTLSADEELAEEVGLRKVTSCEEARDFRAAADIVEARRLAEGRMIDPEPVIIDDGVYRPMEEDADPVDQSRIWKGDPVSSSAYVWLSGAGIDDFCTGFWVSEYHIVTAAHCIDETGWTTVNLLDGLGNLAGTKTSRIFVHEYYDGSGDRNDDIALINIKYGVPWTQSKRRISSGDVVDGKLLDIYGFGDYSTYSSSSGTLREGDGGARIRVDHTYSKRFTADAHQARFCRGDSGGPAIYENGQNAIVWGVASGANIPDNRNCPSEWNNMIWTGMDRKAAWVESKIRYDQEHYGWDYSCNNYGSGDYRYKRCW